MWTNKMHTFQIKYINLKGVHFVDLHYTIVSKCTVQKHKELKIVIKHISVYMSLL
jgi:hypothetical protein